MTDLALTHTGSRCKSYSVALNPRTPMTPARISVAIPSPLVTAAERCARELGRSRSWVVTEALRRYLGGGSEAGEGRSGLALGEYRRAQLEADLALTPEQRVREAEETARLSETGRKHWRAHWVVFFDRYEDYLTWKRWSNLACW